MRPKSQPKGRPFEKGDPRAGRPKGVPNKVTLEMREIARTFVEDEAGRAKMLEQYREGTLNPSLIVMLHHYAYGKPREQIEHIGLSGGAEAWIEYLTNLPAGVVLSLHDRQLEGTLVEATARVVGGNGNGHAD